MVPVRSRASLLAVIVLGALVLLAARAAPAAAEGPTFGTPMWSVSPCFASGGRVNGVSVNQCDLVIPVTDPQCAPNCEYEYWVGNDNAASTSTGGSATQCSDSQIAAGVECDITPTDQRVDVTPNSPAVVVPVYQYWVPGEPATRTFTATYTDQDGGSIKSTFTVQNPALWWISGSDNYGTSQEQVPKPEPGQSTTVDIPVTLSSAPENGQPATVQYTVEGCTQDFAPPSGSTATTSGPYTQATGTLSTSSSSASLSITIEGGPDTLGASGCSIGSTDQDYVTVELSSPENSGFPNALSALSTTINIPLDSLSVVSASATRPAQGQSGQIVFPVLLSGASSAPVSVVASTQDGTGATGAVAGVDYTQTSQTITFPAGTTSENFAVPLIGSAPVAENRTFTVNLSNPSGASLAAGSATGTVLCSSPESSSASAETRWPRGMATSSDRCSLTVVVTPVDATRTDTAGFGPGLTAGISWLGAGGTAGFFAGGADQLAPSSWDNNLDTDFSAKCQSGCSNVLVAVTDSANRPVAGASVTVTASGLNPGSVLGEPGLIAPTEAGSGFLCQAIGGNADAAPPQGANGPCGPSVNVTTDAGGEAYLRYWTPPVVLDESSFLPSLGSSLPSVSVVATATTQPSPCGCVDGAHGQGAATQLTLPTVTSNGVVYTQPGNNFAVLPHDIYQQPSFGSSKKGVSLTASDEELILHWAFVQGLIKKLSGAKKAPKTALALLPELKSYTEDLWKELDKKHPYLTKAFDAASKSADAAIGLWKDLSNIAAVDWFSKKFGITENGLVGVGAAQAGEKVAKTVLGIITKPFTLASVLFSKKIDQATKTLALALALALGGSSYSAQVLDLLTEYVPKWVDMGKAGPMTVKLYDVSYCAPDTACAPAGDFV